MFYSQLFKFDIEVIAKVEEHKRVMQLIPVTITEEDNRDIVSMLEEEEIEKLIQNLLKDKSPSIDGVTAEVLQIFWPLTNQVCIA